MVIIQINTLNYPRCSNIRKKKLRLLKKNWGNVFVYANALNEPKCNNNKKRSCKLNYFLSSFNLRPQIRTILSIKYVQMIIYTNMTR